MKLTILGNNGPYPRSGAACSGYLLSSDSGKTNIIIDFGTGCLAELSKHIEYKKIDEIILSHLHFDHMSDMLPLQYALQFNPKDAPLPVWCPATPEAVCGLLRVPCYDVRTISSHTIGEMEITAVPSRHPVETYAIRIECDGKRFGYTGDTNTLDSLAPFFSGCDLLLADAGLSTQHWNPNAPHLSAAACGVLAREANVGRMLLSHLNPRYSEEELVNEARSEFANTDFTVIGKEYTV